MYSDDGNMKIFDYLNINKQNEPKLIETILTSSSDKKNFTETWGEIIAFNESFTVIRTNNLLILKRNHNNSIDLFDPYIGEFKLSKTTHFKCSLEINLKKGVLLYTDLNITEPGFYMFSPDTLAKE